MPETPSPLLREISSVVGLPATARLIEVFGGVRLYVPKQARPEHKIALLIGLEAAQRLSARFGNEELSIPKARILRRSIRNLALLADHASGMSVRRLALKYDLCERTIWEIIAAHRARSEADVCHEGGGVPLRVPVHARD